MIFEDHPNYIPSLHYNNIQTLKPDNSNAMKLYDMHLIRTEYLVKYIFRIYDLVHRIIPRFQDD